MLRVLAVIAAFALLVYALSDFATSDERDRGGIPKWLWVIIIVVLVYFGPLAWIAYSRSRRSAAAPAAGRASFPGAPARGRRRPNQPVAPDDDPDFLWRLAREQREQARREGKAVQPDDLLEGDPRADGPAAPTGDVVDPPRAPQDPRSLGTDGTHGDASSESTDGHDDTDGSTPSRGPSV